MITRRFSLTLAALLCAAAPALAQGTAADSAHWRATKIDLDSIARDKTAPQYSKRAAARIRARDSLRTVAPPAPPIPPTPTPIQTTRIEIRPSTGTFAVGSPVQFTAIPKAADGTTTTAAVSWSASPSSVATISGVGLLTPIAAGTVTVTARADTASKSATLTISAPIVVDSTPTPAPTPNPTPSPTPTPQPIDTSRFDGVAELPRNVPTVPVTSCATTVRVLAGADLQAAINSAQPGVCLLLAPGATWTGSYTLPNKGSATSFVTIQTEAQLPPIGTRITPAAAANLKLAKILTGAYAPAIRAATGAHHYIIRGVEIGTTAAVQSTGLNMLVDWRDTGTPSIGGIPHHLWLIGNYIHGTPTLDSRRAVFADFRDGGGVDNWIADIHSNGSDSQCWLLLSGGARQLFRNNHCEAGHELFMSGGGGTPDSTFNPSDVAVLDNHFIRPATWKGVWQAKNMFETKNLRRLLVEGNVFENAWPDAQAAFCFVLKSENQYGDTPTTFSGDFTIRYNLIRKCGSGFNISALGSNGTPAIPAARMSIHGNVVDSVGKFGGDGIAIQNLGGTADIQYRANTFLNGLQGFGSNQALSFDGGPAIRLVVDSNVIGHGTYGVKGSGTGDGVSTLTKWAPGALFTNNAIVAGCGTYPATNSCPSSAPTLSSELAKLNAAIAGVVVVDPLSLRPKAIPRGALRIQRPAPKPECQSAAKNPLVAAKCDVPLKP